MRNTVLIVDDVKYNRELLAEVLNEEYDVSIADVYDALVSERVYKSAYSKEVAYEMIVTGECGVFSPKLLDCLCKVRDRFEKLADSDL